MPDHEDDRFPIDRDRFAAEIAEARAIVSQIAARLRLRLHPAVSPFEGEVFEHLMRLATPDEFARLVELKDRALDGSEVPGADERRKLREQWAWVQQHKLKTDPPKDAPTVN